MESSKNYKLDYRRRLPHFQGDNDPVFVTFKTLGSFVLRPDARTGVLENCLHDDGKKLEMIAAVVMPNHVHLLLYPLHDDAGCQYSLAEIMQAIKSTSARKINRVMGRVGPVWQEESFDHVVRAKEGQGKYMEYIKLNPVAAQLCQSPSDYLWLWIRTQA
jgi:REP element-mobilizing transposase RayT